RSARPPTANHAGEPADQGADRTTDRANRRTGEAARNAARGFADVIRCRWLIAHRLRGHITIVGVWSTRHVVPHDRRILSGALAIHLIHDSPPALVVVRYSRRKGKIGTDLNLTWRFRGIDCVAMSNERGDIRIGTQGWNYDAWVGPFYPPETRPADFLTV